MYFTYFIRQNIYGGVTHRISRNYQARNKLLNEIRELTMTDISCELLLYGSKDLGIELSKKVFDAVHRFIDESDRL